MKRTISLPITTIEESDLIELRSEGNHALLGTVGKDGFYYWERRSKSRCLLGWSDVAKLLEEYQKRQSCAIVSQEA